MSEGKANRILDDDDDNLASSDRPDVMPYRARVASRFAKTCIGSTEAKKSLITARVVGARTRGEPRWASPRLRRLVATC